GVPGLVLAHAAAGVDHEDRAGPSETGQGRPGPARGRIGGKGQRLQAGQPAQVQQVTPRDQATAVAISGDEAKHVSGRIADLLRYWQSTQRHPDVGVEKIRHSTSTGGGNGGWGWTTKVSSSTEPSRSK